VEPESWPSAGSPPHNNIIGQDPQLTDPEQGDFRPLPGSPAQGYGCQTFARGALAEDGFAAHSPAVTRGLSRAHSNAHGILPGRAERTTLQAGGPLSGDTIWDADTVRVIDDVLIPPQTRLTIAPAVRVLFEGHFALLVQGNIQAIGPPAEPIHFTSAAPHLFAVDSTTAGSWHGIRFVNTPATGDSSRLEYCILEHCKAAGDGTRGAALHLTGYSKLRVANCIFRNHVADFGGVAYCANFSAPTFTGCLMHSNHAFVSGSAVYCLDAYPLLTGSTIVDNHVLNEEIFDEAGVIHNHISKSTSVACIYHGNSSHYFLPGQFREAKSFYTTYCNIAGGFEGAGNFDLDPLFIESGPDPFALGDGSPCIDAGPLATLGLHLPAWDLAGNPRCSGGRLDVGAYEWPAAAGLPDPWAPDPPAPTAAPLLRAAPNPCRDATGLSVALAAPAHVDLSICDAAGRRIFHVWSGRLAQGHHSFEWNRSDLLGRRLPGGVYWAVLSRDRVLEATRIVLMP